MEGRNTQRMREQSRAARVSSLESLTRQVQQEQSFLLLLYMICPLPLTDRLFNSIAAAAADDVVVDLRSNSHYHSHFHFFHFPFQPQTHSLLDMTLDSHSGLDFGFGSDSDSAKCRWILHSDSILGPFPSLLASSFQTSSSIALEREEEEGEKALSDLEDV